MSDLKHHAFPADYEHDDGVLVPRNKGDVAFSYSDGDGPENYLLELMSASADRSLFSPDLLAGIRDWPSRYHLSPKRANLLRPFSDLLRGNILEVGAGCGAITRFLGENGARVVAVEGSPRRARITRHRTRDLDNVQVVCDRIENIAPTDRFDVVTAIGVLEYAAIYGKNGSDPHISLLRCLRELLTQRGVIILAIENKLGLKYFAGAREDHTGAAFDGINDGYRPGSVATFGASELGRLLDSAGFRARTWFLPCPDYKLPTTILSASLLNRHPDLAATLAAQAAPVDPQRPADPTFSLEQAWSVLGENALLGELANSFLVIAGTCAEAVAPFQRLSDLAWHFSVDRHPAFAKETRFVNGGDGLSIERHPLTRTRPPAVPIRQVLEPEPLRRGSNWWNELVAILNRNNWSVSQIADWARVWTSALVSECGLDALNSDTFHTHVDGLYFDLAPFNMVRDANGQTHFFDREWHLTPSVEFGFVVVRGLRDSLGRVPSCAAPAPGTPQTINQLVINVLAELGILISRAEIDRYAQLEGQIQAWVQGRSVSGVTADTLQAQWNASLRQRSPADRVSIASERQQLQRSIEELRGKLGGVETARASLASELEEAKAAAIRQAGEIARLEAVRVENEARIDQAARDLTGAREMARDSQSQTQRLGGELAAAQQDLARARQDYESGRAELIAASRDRDDRIDALTQQLADVQQRLQERDARIRAHIAERDAKAQALATALDESARAAADFAAEHARLTASAEERAGRIDTLTREIHAARARLQEREAQLQAIAADRNATLKTLAAEREAQRAALTAAHAERDAHTAALSAIREQLARNIHDHHAERARLLADAQARDNRIGEIAAQLAAAQRQLQERDAQFGALSAEREAQAQALATAQHRARDHEARLGALTAERDAQLRALTAERDAQLQALATARDAVRQDADRAAAERDAAIARLADETGRTRALTPQLEAQTARAARAEEEAARLRAERDALRETTRAELAQREQERDAQARTAQIAQAQSEQLRATLAQQAQALAALAPPARRSPLSALRALTQRFTGWRRTDYRHQAWEAETIRASGLFSALDYVTRYPDVAETGDDPLLHYLRSGAAEGRAPHPLFDAAYYLRQHPEAAEAKMTPLAHYATAGVAAGFDPHPLFDTDWYLHRNPDVAKTGVNPLFHYMTQGWREGRDPHPQFDTSFYLEHNPDVAAAGENPLIHYCTFGRNEGRDTHPDSARSLGQRNNDDHREEKDSPQPEQKYEERSLAAIELQNASAPDPQVIGDLDLIRSSELFDADWYARKYPDIKDLDPLMHFYHHGGREGRKAGPNFDAGWYLAHYPDVANSSINPLVHYLRYGRAEGRTTGLTSRTEEIVRATIESLTRFEPTLGTEPSFAYLDRLPVSRGINRSRLAATWKLLFEALRAPYDHLIFVPWLTHGGADLVAINALNAAIEAHGPSSTLLIATDYERTDAIDWLPANAHFLSMSAFEPELKHEDRIRLVELLIYTVRPKSVLNVNSRACWDAFARRGIALSRISRLYAHLFCHDYGANDLPAGYAATHLRTCTNTISQVYFDNQRFLDEMDEELCLPSQLKERFKFLPQPMLTTIERAPKIIRRSPSNTVLWAGRFSRQKNIELLISIAKLCPELDFHVYGSGDAKHTEMLRESAGALRNLKTKGQFASADTLKVDAFSAFLFTSRWEGMPTILINLAARGIPIVASDVGGVRELVNERTGWLIESTVDPAPYAAALREAITSNALVTDKLENMMSLVHARHSWTTFKQALSQPDWLLGE